MTKPVFEMLLSCALALAQTFFTLFISQVVKNAGGERCQNGHWSWMSRQWDQETRSLYRHQDRGYKTEEDWTEEKNRQSY